MNRIAFFAAAVVVALVAGPSSAQSYKADPVHSSAVFRLKHANVSYFWGRFTAPTGTFTLDEADPTKSSFAVELQVGSVDTGNEKRDAHLKSPDFFNAKQYPTITFKSTAVKKGEGNLLAVTGDLTLHGVTKAVTVSVEPTGTGEFPKGTKRAGIEATVTVKMTDFEMKAMPGMLSDEVRIVVSFSGMGQ